MESDYRHWDIDMIFFLKSTKNEALELPSEYPVSICRLNDWENIVPLLLKDILEAQNDDKSLHFTHKE